MQRVSNVHWTINKRVYMPMWTSDYQHKLHWSKLSIICCPRFNYSETLTHNDLLFGIIQRHIIELVYSNNLHMIQNTQLWNFQNVLWFMKLNKASVYIVFCCDFLWEQSMCNFTFLLIFLFWYTNSLDSDFCIFWSE